MQKRFNRWGGTAIVTFLLGGCAAQMHHRSGMEALEKRNYPLAMSELAQASKLAPDDMSYRRDSLRVRETTTDTLLASAQEAIAGDDRAKAGQAYSTVLSYDPSNGRAQAGLGRLRELSLADEDVKEATLEVKAGNLPHAAELVGRALKRAPKHAGAMAIRRELDAFDAQQAMTSASLSQVYKKPINLEFRDTNIKLVFDALSRTTGINFIFDRDVRPDQRTTIFLKQTSLDDAIDVILSTGQLEKKVLNPSSVLIYPSTAAKQREYQDLLVRAFYLANVEAKQAASMLKTVLKIKDIFVDEKYNMLVLRENPETIGLAEKLIRLQDLEEPEVMLEIEVLEINRSRLLNAGIQWSSQLTLSPLSGASSGATGGATAAMKLSDLRALTAQSIGISLPTATINLQNTDGDANLLANPRIRVRDREKAKILIGDKVPVVTTTTTNTFVTENIQYLDVGLKLEVEPDIHLRDEIGLKLVLEVSSLVSSVKTNNGSLAYQIGTRNFSSALRLKDGETQILAGLISDEDRSSANRIPLIGQLPVLGRLFGSQTDTRRKTEIVLSITPHLIRNIQRQTPAAESFWSGTEANLRDRPLQLRTVQPDGSASAPAIAPAPAPQGPTNAVPPVSATGPNAPKVNWEGPASAKVGELVQLYLAMDNAEALRAATLQIAYNPAEFELVSVVDSGYFGKDDKTVFSKSIDNGSGRASVGLKAPDGAPAGGTGRMLGLTVKPLVPSPGATISVISMTAIGAQKAIGRPGLPLSHTIALTR